MITAEAQEVVPFVGLARQHAALGGELRAAFERVVGTDGFILGGEVEAFEREFAGYCEAAECVGVASGTAALALVLIAAGIGPGDEVLVPGHTFIASALGVLHAGATPVFCDVQRDTGLLDPDAAAARVGERTAAVIAVHLYGQVCDMDPINALAARHGLFVLEDAAQAHGATYNGVRAGSLGDAAAFSFYPSKNLGALGDGGAICTDDDELAATARRLRDLGRDGAKAHVSAGYNERLDGLQAALLAVKLPHVDAWNEARRGLALRYREALGAGVELLEEAPASSCSYHLFPIRVDRRDLVAAAMLRLGIQTSVHYPAALCDQPALPMLAGASTPVALDWAARELSLPIFAGMTAAELETVIAALRFEANKFALA